MTDNTPAYRRTEYHIDSIDLDETDARKQLSRGKLKLWDITIDHEKKIRHIELIDNTEYQGV